MLLLAVSCGKEQGPDTPPAATTEGTVFLPQTEGQEVRIIVSASGEWSISSDVDWAAVFPLSGGAGENTIVIRTMDANPKLRERVAYFDMTITDGQPKRYYLVQKGIKGVEIVSPLSVIDSKEGGKIEITVLANTEFTAELDVPWASVSGIRYNQDSVLLDDGINYSDLRTAVLDMDVMPYGGTESRDATISIFCGDENVGEMSLVHSAVQWNRRFYKRSVAAKFTGQSCSWCSYMSDGLHAAQVDRPDRMEIMNLYGYHDGDELYWEGAGTFDEFFTENFRTGAPYTVFNEVAGVQSYGYDIDGLKNKLLELIDWGKEEVPARSALYVRSALNGSRLNVSGFAALKESMEDCRISIFILEDGITASQAGRGNDYVHDDVVRYAVTEVLGEPLVPQEELVPGDAEICVFSKSVTLPEGVFRDGDSSKARILAYVTCAEDNVPDNIPSEVNVMELGTIVDNVVSLPLNGEISVMYE